MRVERMTPLLQVFDMPRSVAFYRDVLGFEVVSTSPPRGPDDFDWGLLRLADIHLMLNTRYEVDDRPPEPDARRVEAHDDIGLFFGCPDVDGAYAHLKAKGLDLQPPRVTPYGMKQLYLRDPDGYVICLQWRASDGP